jgi:hypothetical protein
VPRGDRAIRQGASPKVVLGVLVYFGALAALRLWWGCEAQRRFRAACENYRAAGGVLRVEELLPERVPDAENAAELLRQAWAALSPAVRTGRFNQMLSDPQAVQTAPAEVEQLLADNQTPLRLLRESRFLPGCDWSSGATLLGQRAIGGSSKVRTLAKLAVLAARYHHYRSNDREALELLEDVLTLGQRCSQDPGFIAVLAAVAAHALAAAQIEFVAPRLNVADELAQNESSAVPATRQQVQDLINRLLDDRDLREGWTRAVYGEAAELIELTNLIANDRPYVPAALPPGQAIQLDLLDHLLLKPAWLLDGARRLRSYQTIAYAANLGNWPAASAQLKTALAPEPPNALFQWAYGTFWFSVGQAPLEQVVRCIAERRMAATALAIRLYELDQGRRPDRLDELVPRYLPAVPQDPLAAYGRPLGYRPDATPPVLYSVGLDGIDQGGQFVLRRDGSVDHRAADLVFFLDGNRPRARQRASQTQPTASSQAVPDQSEP